jgi:hypothetical protein
MSGMDAAIQAVLLQAQALNQIAANIPAVLPGPTFTASSAGSCTLSNVNPQTTITDATCLTTSKIFLTPTSGAAGAAVVSISLVSNGSFEVDNPGLAVGCTFFYLIVN